MPYANDITGERKGKVGKSKFFCDIVQYAKSIGYVHRYATGSLGNNPDGSGEDLDSALFDFNPSNINRYYFTGNQNADISVRFKNDTGYGYAPNKQWSNLLQCINYYGILGWDGSTGTQNPNFPLRTFTCRMQSTPDNNTDHMNAITTEVSPIVGNLSGDADCFGFALMEVSDTWDVHPNYSRLQSFLYKSIGNQSANPFTQGEWVDVGCLLYGISFTTPHNANVSLSINNSMEGVKEQRTIGGSSVQNISYIKPPDWGNNAPWVHYHPDDLQAGLSSLDVDFRPVAPTGRRSWDLTWSFLSYDDTFPSSDDGVLSNMGGEWLSSTGTFNKKNTLTNVLGLSCNGSIPIIFQPDTLSREFAKVVIDTKTLKISQQSPTTYQVKMKLKEVW